VVLAFWTCKCQHEGTPVAVADLNPDLIQHMSKEKVMAEKEERQDASFDYRKYIQWEHSLENYLDSCHGCSKIPLSYVIHPNDVNPDESETEYEHVIWFLAPHKGLAFEEDNCKVYQIYKDLMNGTNGWAWFNQV
jgi:hypothetical protein